MVTSPSCPDSNDVSGAADEVSGFSWHEAVVLVFVGGAYIIPYSNSLECAENLKQTLKRERRELAYSCMESNFVQLSDQQKKKCNLCLCDLSGKG